MSNEANFKTDKNCTMTESFLKVGNAYHFNNDCDMFFIDEDDIDTGRFFKISANSILTIIAKRDRAEEIIYSWLHNNRIIYSYDESEYLIRNRFAEKLE